VASLAFVAAWPTAAWFADRAESVGLAEMLRGWGWVLTYLLGLVWCIWGIERGAQYLVRTGAVTPSAASSLPWHPLNPQSYWYSPLALSIYSLLFFLGFTPFPLMGQFLSGKLSFGRMIHEFAQRLHDPLGGVYVLGVLCSAVAVVWNLVADRGTGSRGGARLRQSVAVLSGYSFAFLLLYFLVNLPSASGEGPPPFDSPYGGGSDQAAPAPRTVRVQKIQRKKYVINPYSALAFNPPTIDTVNLRVGEETRHEYRAGYGDGTGTGEGGIGSGSGKGSGFGSGTGSGEVRLPRLKHPDKNWNKNFGIGGDNNMLVQFSLLSKGMKVAEKTEALDTAQLARLPFRKGPPLLLVTGTDSFQLTATDKKVLKQYLLERCGMILGDNLGGSSFHNQFIQAMRDITGVQEVPIPRDDYIHSRPFLVHNLPIVVAHGGTVALGWKVEGRWVAYYHPGALSDAWRDDHAGIKRDVWEACYVLGSNILFYAYLEKHKWNEAQGR
jgi:hypothetical protein